MAGSYPDVPAHRVAYDRDGTAGFWIPQAGGSPIALTTAELQLINDEDADALDFGSAKGGPKAWVGLIFPALRTIFGYSIACTQFDGSLTPMEMQTSVLTSNGVDGGDWTTVASPWANQNTADPSPAYRTSIQAVSFSNIKAVRWRADSNAGSGAVQYRAVHFYGTVISTLKPWHPTSDVEIGGAAQDWGDIASASNGSRQFRIKNTHGSQTAHAVVVTCEALSDKTPSQVAQRSFSYAGSTPAASVAIGDLAPGAVSGVITVERDTPSGAAAGLGAVRYVAQAGSWS